MSNEVAEMMAAAKNVMGEINDAKGQSEVRDARLKLALALIRTGVSPKEAIVQAKLLVVDLFSAVPN